MSSERFAHYWVYIFGKVFLKLRIIDRVVLDLHNLHFTGSLRNLANPLGPFRIENIAKEMFESLSINKNG